MQNYSVQGNYIFIKHNTEEPQGYVGRSRVVLSFEQMDILHALVYSGVEYDDELIQTPEHTKLKELGLITVGKLAPGYSVISTDDSDKVIKLTKLGYLVATDFFFDSCPEDDSEQGITRVLPVTLPTAQWNILQLNAAAGQYTQPMEDFTNQLLFDAVCQWVGENISGIPPEVHSTIASVIEGTPATTSALADLLVELRAHSAPYKE